jgi:hypothetical protein
MSCLYVIWDVIGMLHTILVNAFVDLQQKHRRYNSSQSQRFRRFGVRADLRLLSCPRSVTFPFPYIPSPLTLLYQLSLSMGRYLAHPSTHLFRLGHHSRPCGLQGTFHSFPPPLVLVNPPKTYTRNRPHSRNQMRRTSFPSLALLVPSRYHPTRS